MKRNTVDIMHVTRDVMLCRQQIWVTVDRTSTLVLSVDMLTICANAGSNKVTMFVTGAGNQRGTVYCLFIVNFIKLPFLLPRHVKNCDNLQKMRLFHSYFPYVSSFFFLCLSCLSYVSFFLFFSLFFPLFLSIYLSFFLSFFLSVRKFSAATAMAQLINFIFLYRL
jgi:hypothetical protein